MYVVPSLNTNCGWLAEPVKANAYVGTGSDAYVGTGAMKFHTGYGNGKRMPYRKNTAGRAANRCTTTTLPRGRANGPGPARACGKAAPFETSSPKSAKQIVRRMRHPRAYYLRPCGTGRNYRPASFLFRASHLSRLAERARVPYSIVPLTRCDLGLWGSVR